MQQKKRSRASHPKVRTGCNTCKARRVKCDELRPSCQKCLSTGRTCEGYKNTREWVIIVAPPPPVTDGFEDDRSRRHFDYFRTHAVYELSWFFDGSNWGSLVLKESHSSAAVRHAVIALACSHQDFRDNLTVAAQAPQYAYATQQYSKAIRNLIKETSQDVQESRLKALMCGLLFISIEILRGNDTAARHHLDGCLKIVREAQTRMGTLFRPTEVHPLERDRLEAEAHLCEEIIPMFSRIDVQASAVGLLGGEPTNEASDSSSRDSPAPTEDEVLLLSSFQTINQASYAMLLLANRLHRFLNMYSDIYRNQCVRPIPADILAEKCVLYHQFLRWESAIQPLLATTERQHDYDKLTIMRLHNRTGLLLSESCLDIEECVHDNYQWAFEGIVNLTAELKHRTSSSDEEGASESGSSTTSERGQSSNSTADPSNTSTPALEKGMPRQCLRPFFCLDSGVIFALYWTALKSRDGTLRRRAVALLEHPAQEGVWVGPIQAAIAKRVIEIEEGQLYEQYPPPARIKRPEDIHENMRVHSVTPDIDKARRRAKLVILQKPHGLEGEWHERVECARW